MNELIIAVDPGREKCGIAVVDRQQGVVHKEIIPTEKLVVTIQNLLMKYSVTRIVLGDRTTSKEAKRALETLRSSEKPLEITLVDEHRSTDAARKRYWQEQPPRGLRALFPTTMQTPPVPVDDYVAVILAERFFEKA